MKGQNFEENGVSGVWIVAQPPPPLKGTVQAWALFHIDNKQKFPLSAPPLQYVIASGTVVSFPARIGTFRGIAGKGFDQTDGSDLAARSIRLMIHNR